MLLGGYAFLISTGLGTDPRESLTLDFKLTLPDQWSAREKRRFLASVVAFANTAGGDLVYGIRELDGVATAIEPLDVMTDEQQLTMEALLRCCVSPRLAVGFRWIRCDGGRHVLVVRVPRSWNGPHGYRHETEHLVFHARNTAGKHVMNVDELRDAFAESSGALAQAENFRATRLAAISDNDIPVPIVTNGAHVIIHLVPLVALTRRQTYDLRELPRSDGSPYPAGNRNAVGHPNFDGYLSRDVVMGNDDEQLPSRAYLQLFRDGKIETVTDWYPTLAAYGKIAQPSFDAWLLGTVQRLLTELESLGVPPPIWIGITLRAVLGMELPVASDFRDYDQLRMLHPIDHDELRLPANVLDGYQDFCPEQMKSTLDALWNAAGWRQSNSFTQDGEWRCGAVEDR